MSDVFVYKRRPGRAVVWLTAAVTAALAVAVYWFEIRDMTALLVMFMALTIGWMFVPRPTYGMRLDQTYLTLAAWRNPRAVALDSIAHIEAKPISDEISCTIVFRDGRREGIFALDLPDQDRLIDELAKRGIPVRGDF